MADIDSVVAFAQTQIVDVKALAETAQTDLANVAKGHLEYFEFNAPPVFTPEVKFTLNPVTLDTVNDFKTPVINADTITMPASTTAPAFTKPTLTGGFSPDTFDPAAIDGEITSLSSAVIQFINSGGPGISNSVQDALANNMRERDLQILSDSILNVAANDALSGFPLQTSMTLAAKNEVIKKYHDAKTDRNRDITALMTERAHQTAMKALDAGVSLTQIKSSLKAEVGKLYYSLQSLILEQFKVEVSAEISKYENDIKKIIAEIEVYKTKFLAENGINIEKFKVEAMGEELRVRSDLTLASTKAEIDLKSNEIGYGAALKEAQLKLEQWVQTVNNLTERGKADITQATNANLRRVEASKNQAEYYKGIIAGFSNMVNTIQFKKQ